MEAQLQQWLRDAKKADVFGSAGLNIGALNTAGVNYVGAPTGSQTYTASSLVAR